MYPDSRRVIELDEWASGWITFTLCVCVRIFKSSSLSLSLFSVIEGIEEQQQEKQQVIKG